MSKTILAIDDHPDTIQLIELALQRHGYDVIGAYSGPEGLEIAEKVRPDLILLDMMMPGMDGNAVCRAIRQDPDLAATPIIMFTAKSQATDKKVSFDAGADDYLTKPTRPNELLQRIQALLSRNELQREPPLPSAPAASRAAGAAPPFITVIGARGGAGATTVALNIAATLANAETRTILADLDTRQGHAAVYLGHTVTSDLLDWLDQPGDALAASLPGYLVEIQSHFRLLPSRLRLEGAPAALEATQTGALATALHGSGGAVVVDAGSHDSDALLPLLQQSDTILICLRPERPAVIGARHLFERLSEQVDPQKLQLLLLQYQPQETIPRAAIESYLQTALCEVIQLDEQAITRAVNRHQPLIASAGGEMLRPFQQLVNILASTTVA